MSSTWRRPASGARRRPHASGRRRNRSSRSRSRSRCSSCSEPYRPASPWPSPSTTPSGSMSRRPASSVCVAAARARGRGRDCERAPGGGRRLPPVLGDIPRRLVRLPLEGLGGEDIDRLLDESLGVRLAPTAQGAFTGCREGTRPRPRDRQGNGCRSVRRRHPARLARPPHPGAPRGPDTRLVPSRCTSPHSGSKPRPPSRRHSGRRRPVRAHGGTGSRHSRHRRGSHPVRAAPRRRRAARRAGRRRAPRGASAACGGRRRTGGTGAAPCPCRDGPDADVAAALDDAAERAHARGAPDAAADLSELAADLTAENDPAHGRRLAAAGRYRVVAGDVARADAARGRAARSGRGRGHRTRRAPHGAGAGAAAHGRSRRRGRTERGGADPCRRRPSPRDPCEAPPRRRELHHRPPMG